MRRLVIEQTEMFPHFIGSWDIEPVTMCEDLVEFFEDNSAYHRIGQAGDGAQNDGVKKSTDMTIRPSDVSLSSHVTVRTYIDSLFACYKDYLTIWPFLGQTLPEVEIGSFNIQRYHTGEHFQRVHAERHSIYTLHRVLAWMTYLNDVEDGGATFFPHYDLKIKPERGKTLIWPADWTHAHCGEVVGSGSKYVITGWMHFPT
mgnify:CR=1 FL=1|tara:strand:- start:141 stop:743 length:603 start_codon:yes stop_codon:yes gene_type:complete